MSHSEIVNIAVSIVSIIIALVAMIIETTDCFEQQTAIIR